MLLSVAALTLASFRPPAVPLFTHTPSFSVWSAADRLTDAWPTHWTGGNQAMFGQVRIDGKVYRWMGPNPNLNGRPDVPPIPQTALHVTATRSTYVFQAGGVELQAEFCSPLLADDLEILGRTVSFVTLRQRSLDGKPHQVSAYFDVCGEMVVDRTGSRVDARRHQAAGLNIVSLRSVDHAPLARSGDRVKDEAGAIYLNGPGRSFIASDQTARAAFQDGKLPDDDDRFPRAAHDRWPVIGYQFDLKEKPETIAVAYDEGYALEFFGRKLRPYWNRREIGPVNLLRQATGDFASVRARCEALDAQIAKEAGELGPEYAQMMALAYRQCLAAHGLAEDFSVGLLHFSKENSSNGCIATVDVTFPAAPFFLQFSPALLRAQIVPILEYSASPRWRFDFAPHDLGQYPLANGQVYGGGETSEENQMPVEETANMLLMLAGLERKQSDIALLKRFWPLLGRWAAYLEAKGLDPENQLCTDDFSGHLARNANLSVKAIVAIRAYAELAERVGDAKAADKYKKLSVKWVGDWSKLAAGGQPTVLAFGQANTWSMKYNLMWDRLLGYKIFPESLVKGEVSSYLAKANQYGTPLDQRAAFTKTDWLFWAAALTNDQAEFQKFALPAYKWVNETPDRVPFSDWYDTKSGRQSGFQARSVIGGIAAPMLMRSWTKGN